MKYSLQDIIKIIGGKAFGKTEKSLILDTLLTDSRSLTTPESTIFFAIKTSHGNGNDYIPQLYKAGVRAFVCVSNAIETTSMPEATFICVDNPLVALQDIARHHRQAYMNGITVGITGSNGKTIVKEWLYQLLGDKQKTVRSPKSYNSQIGVPLSVTLIEENTRLALFEAGISQPNEMQNLARIINPDVVVFTNIGSAHQENFINLNQKALEKLQLAKDASKIIYPVDNQTIAQAIALQEIGEERLFGWSTTNQGAFVYVSCMQTKENSTTITCKIQNEQDVAFTIPFIDSASIQNCITVFTTALALGYDAETIGLSMERLESIAMRLEVKEGLRGLTLINDSYNSDVNSLSIALDFMGRRLQQSDQPRILILSDILQSGEDKNELYSKVADLVGRQHINRILTVGSDLKKYSSLFSTEVSCFLTTKQLIASTEFALLHDATILIKGARSFRFDRITDLLQKRVHETILEVNLNAIVDNLNHYRSLMKPGEKIVCMVKASAYGAGSIEVSKTLQDHNVDYLAVAVADEGVALRNGGINGNIMIMNPEMTSFHDLFQYRLEPEVYDFKLLRALIHAANNEGVTNFPIHLKLDTGMHRLGIDPVNDIEQLIDILQHQDALKPVSVFSHFVGSDGDAFDEFTHQQFALFDKASLRIQGAFPHRILRHICNSAGIERFPQYHLDMVRLGIGLYGINPFDNSVINTVSTLKTTILQIRNVPATDTVGYSRWGKLNRPSRIAAIPIGYADGLNRHLGRGVGYCLVNGQKARYVGNICMDVCMIDVTDIDCCEGDMVEIFGENLPVTILSDLLDTIPYEILTSVSERVKRVYFS